MKKLSIALLFLASCSPDPTPPPPKAAPEAPGREPAMMAPPQHPAPAEHPSLPSSDLIKFDAPAGWVKEEPSNRMRNAQYRVPDKEKKGKDALFTLFFFRGPASPIEDNIRRWASQMGVSDPKPEVFQGKCKVTLVDLAGTYTGDAQTGPQENSRLLSAVVETPDGPWFFKLLGPAETVGPWREEFVSMLKGAGGK